MRFPPITTVAAALRRGWKADPRVRARAVVGVLLAGLAISFLAGIAAQTGARGAAGVLLVEQPRVVILKSRRLLLLLDGDRLVRTYPVDLGVRPVGTKRRMGDGRTPHGRFRVVSKNGNSQYHRFIGLSYPDLAAVAWGLTRGLISPGEAASIRQAHAEGRCPDWRTALGGGIGIHGHRKGRDWTGGCVAVSDSHVEELFSVLRIGDPVEILP